MTATALNSSASLPVASAGTRASAATCESSSGSKGDGEVASLGSSRDCAFSLARFWGLVVAAVLGVLAVVPYALALFSKFLDATARMPLPLLITLQVLQGTLIFGALAALGLLLARSVGLGAPLLTAALYRNAPRATPRALLVPAIAGAVAGGVAVAVVLFIVWPLVPQWPIAAEAALPVWKRFLASFYGAINEELLMRLFLLSLVLWTAQRLLRRSGQPSVTTSWVANVIAALLFGAGHIPAAATILPLTPFVVSTLIVLNGALGLLFGYYYITRGFEAAMVAHFAGDFVMHVVGAAWVKA